MKRILLLPIGLIPLIAGFGMNYIISDLNIYGTGFTLISIAFLFVWFFIGFGVARTKIDFPSVIIFSFAIGIINYVFIVYQMLIMDKWANGILGLASQFYILPSLRMLNFINWIGIFNSSIGYTTGAMLILFAIFFAGAYISRRQMNAYNEYWGENNA